MRSDALLHFVHTATFDRSLGMTGMTDADLHTLQATLQANPEAGDIIQGAGGARKVRVAIPARGKGKRGGARVIYFYRPTAETVYLLLAYGKDAADDLSAAGKRLLRDLLATL